jgi:hypothetical protein
MVQVASVLFSLRGNWSGRSSLIGDVRRRLPGSPWSAAPCGRRRELRARRVSSSSLDFLPYLSTTTFELSTYLPASTRSGFCLRFLSTACIERWTLR